MEDSKRRAYIKQQAAKKKQEGNQPHKGTSSANPSTKRKSSEKTNHLPKKPKVVLEFVVGKGKGHMTGLASIEKPPVLLHEDSKYALEQLSSIITADNYEDLNNHATKAMGEMGLFSIAQVTMFILFLFFFLFLISNPSFIFR